MIPDLYEKKLFYLLTICISGWLSLFGQIDTITIKFQEHSENTEIAGLLEALDADEEKNLKSVRVNLKFYENFVTICRIMHPFI